MDKLDSKFRLFLQGYAQQRELSKRTYLLPESCNFSGVPSLQMNDAIARRLSARASVAFLLVDVTLGIMTDLCLEFSALGAGLQQNTKRRFNDCFKAAKQFKAALLRAGNDVSVVSDDIADDYFRDSDYLREVVELLYDRTLGNEDTALRVKSLLYNFPTMHTGLIDDSN